MLVTIFERREGGRRGGREGGKEERREFEREQGAHGYVWECCLSPGRGARSRGTFVSDHCQMTLASRL